MILNIIALSLIRIEVKEIKAEWLIKKQRLTIDKLQDKILYKNLTSPPPKKIASYQIAIASNTVNINWKHLFMCNIRLPIIPMELNNWSVIAQEKLTLIRREL